MNSTTKDEDVKQKTESLVDSLSRVNYLCRLTTIIFAGHPQKN